jgi:putative ABC transport system permease protein
MRPGLLFVSIRLAIRNGLRRKGEALLVVLGTLLGTAIITSAFVVGDTLHATIRDEARTRLGPIDEIALVHDASLLGPALQRIVSRPLPDTDGVLPVVTASVAVTSQPDPSRPRRSEPDAFVQELNFDAARAFGGRPDDTGLVDGGPTPTGDEAVIGEDLADALGVRPGDTIEVFAYGQTRPLTVRNIVPRLGLAGFHPGFASRAQNVFVAPGTLAAMAQNAPPGAVLPEGRILVSNVGGVFDSAGPSDEVLLQLQIQTAGVGPIEFTDEKQQTLAFADRQGRNFSRLFGLIGSFTVVAGVLLLINIFVMLAEERKSELGTLRALGFTRRHLVRIFGFEGSAYSVVAAAIGALVGVGVGRIVVRVTEGIFAQGRRGIVGLQFAVRPSSLVAGFAIGLAIALLTVWGTSVRISRLNVIRAIRDAPEPPPLPRSRRSLALAGAGVALGVIVFAVAVLQTLPILALVGPALVAWCSVPLLSARLPRRLAISAPCLVLLTYAVLAFALMPSVFDNSDIEVFFVQGLVLVLTGVILVVTNDDQFRWVSNRLSARGGGLATRLGLANPLAKRFRTGLLLGMYALVVFVLVFMAVFAAVFQAQAPRLTAETSAGYDLRVDSSLGNPVTAAQLQEQEGVDVAIPLVRSEAQFQTSPDATTSFAQRLTGYDESLLARGVPKLSARDARFGDDEAVWRAVLTQPELVIVPASFMTTGGAPARNSVRVGQALTLVDASTGRRHPLTIVGLNGSLDPAENGAMVASATLPILVDRTSASRFYVAVEPGASPDDVAQRLQGALVANGVKADTFAELVDDRLRAQTQFIALLEGFLSLGLLIGIAGLGVVMVRAVRERRREIGMLRAMGFAASVVRRAFMIEAAFIAVQGIVIGGVLGVVTGFSVLSNSSTFGGEELPFTVPWFALFVLAAITLGASLLAVTAPANQASRIKPAVALRMTD